MARDLAKRASNIGSRAFSWVTILGVALLMSTVLMEPCQGSDGSNNGYVEPENCKRLDCPRYQVVLSRKEYEIRSYKLANWVATSPINSASFNDAVSQGFLTLFGYIQGNNNQRAKLNMTAPVLVDVVPSQSASTSYIVHFYLPKNYQSNPPQSQVAHPVKLPKHRNYYAAVRRFGGFMTDADIPPQVSALKKSLIGSPWELPAGASAAAPNGGADKMGYSVAGYNSPFEFSGRVNEVIMWLDKN